MDFLDEAYLEPPQAIPLQVIKARLPYLNPFQVALAVHFLLLQQVVLLFFIHLQREEVAVDLLLMLLAQALMLVVLHTWVA